MKAFNVFAPTEIIFGEGVLAQLGTQTARFGKKALLVTGHSSRSLDGVYADALRYLAEAGVSVCRFDGVIPNPTTGVVTAGAAAARGFGAEVVIGLGGGSAMDTAKAIAVEATHEGTVWDYLHYTAGPTEKTLPIIAVGTTAGTGSQTTPCAVVTNPVAKDKSAVWHRNIYPRVALVDPLLTAGMPPAITAQTGFDAFCHNFEAYLSVNASAYSDALALDAIGRVAKWLPVAVADGTNREARMQMSWADTLGGLTNAAAGVTLPHGLGMQIGGHCPQVTHGQALAALYPAFTRFTVQSAQAKFATVGRILDPALRGLSDESAAAGCCNAIDGLLRSIGLWIGLSDVDVTFEELRAIADCGQVLGDYKNNPRVATIEEMYALLRDCYQRD